MIKNLENLGSSRKGFSLTCPPPRVTYAARRGRSGEVVPPFEPYEENLPLESGFYTFVIDADGRFRVKRGNTSSHSSMVGGEKIGAAGRFRINRAGNVAEIFCGSYDYGLGVRSSGHATVAYVIDSFVQNHALELSPLAVFQFSVKPGESFFVSIDGQPIADLTQRLKLLDGEGQGREVPSAFSTEQIDRFRAFVPEKPPRLYGMHADQLIIAVEGDDQVPFEFGSPMPPYRPGSEPLNSGKKAFVIDEDGCLIVGPYGHHLLSGGQMVGGAGQIVLDPDGAVSEINLNFSGHYRPPLDAIYARYVHRSLSMHPLLKISPSCKISGRKFDDRGELSTVLRFEVEDLQPGNEDLDLLIEMFTL